MSISSTQAGAMWLHKLADEITVPGADENDAVELLIAQAATMPPTISEAMLTIGARVVLAEARRRRASAEKIVPPSSDEACVYCEYCGRCRTCSPERVIGKFHDCQAARDRERGV